MKVTSNERLWRQVRISRVASQAQEKASQVCVRRLPLISALKFFKPSRYVLTQPDVRGYRIGFGAGDPQFMKEFEMENSGSDYSNSEWKKLVKEAVVEVNPDRLKEKVAEAEAAIFQRLQALERGSDNSSERFALQDASNTLLALKREVLKYPDWKSE